MAAFYCSRCQSEVVVPDDLPDKIRRRTVALRRADQSAAAYEQLESDSALNLSMAQRLVLHITLESGICHRCGNILVGGSEVYCTACKALNLDW